VKSIVEEKHEPIAQCPTINSPANYKIRVLGRLGERWAARMGGMRVSEWRRPDGDTETVLEGWLEDQAALAGVFNALCELQLPLLSVRCVDAGE
jgi:hypothetical protein